MFKSWFLIILIFVGGITGVLGWLTDFIPYYSFSLNAESAVAVPVSNLQKPSDPFSYLGEIRYQFPLRFTTKNGKEIISSTYYKNTYVPKSAIDAIEKNGQVTILYLPDEPQRVLFEGDIEKLPKGLISLAWGIVGIILAIYLVPHRYRIARYTKYLGHSDICDN